VTRGELGQRFVRVAIMDEVSAVKLHEWPSDSEGCACVGRRTFIGTAWRRSNGLFDRSRLPLTNCNDQNILAEMMCCVGWIYYGSVMSNVGWSASSRYSLAISFRIPHTMNDQSLSELHACPSGRTSRLATRKSSVSTAIAGNHDLVYHIEHSDM
jgi:hypothetical protein